MDFAYRIHTAFADLDPGESTRFARAPVTAGKTVMKIGRLGGGTDRPGDFRQYDGAPPMEDADWKFAGDPAEPRIDGCPGGSA
jgi:hypothetical protein